MNEALQRAIELFDMESYVEETFNPIRRVVSNQDEIQVNCFAPSGCGSDFKQHLYVNITKKRWYCHKCGYGDSRQQFGSGSLVRFMADAEGVRYAVIVERLLGIVVPTPDEDLTEYLVRAFAEQAELEEEQAPKVITLPKEIYLLRETGRTATTYREYALNRGFTLADLTALDMRYVVKYAFPLKEGENKDKRRFEWKWRVVFPIVDLEGNYRSAVGRSITTKQENAWAAWPNSDIRDLVWPLGHWEDHGGLWVPMKLQSNVAVLVEGVPDAHAVNTLTEHQAFCTFGKKISNLQMGLLSQLGVEQIILAWDCDAKEQIKRAVEKLAGRFEVFVFPFRAAGWQAFDFGDVLARKMDDPDCAQQILVEELACPLPVESPEYCAWVFE